MSSRHHIPFPRTFLTVNVPLRQSGNNKASSSSASSSSTTSVQEPTTTTTSTSTHQPTATLANGFLSNRPAPIASPAPRHASISSVSSDESTSNATVVSDLGTNHEQQQHQQTALKPAARGPAPGEFVPAWLALNDKYAVPPAVLRVLGEAERGGFLSNSR